MNGFKILSWETLETVFVAGVVILTASLFITASVPGQRTWAVALLASPFLYLAAMIYPGGKWRAVGIFIAGLWLFIASFWTVSPEASLGSDLAFPIATIIGTLGLIGFVLSVRVLIHE